MRFGSLMLAILSLGGCDGEGPTYSGFRMTDFFPLGPDVVGWTFGNTDDTVDHRLVRTLTVEDGVNPESRGDSLVVWTWSVSAECIDAEAGCETDGFQYDLKLSSDTRRGVQFHGYETPSTGLIEFEAPLTLADPRMVSGASVESAGVDGHDFIATFEGTEGCNQTISVSWECARIVLTSEPAGHWLEGTYKATAGYNIVAFQRTDDPGEWRTIRNPVLASDAED